MKCVDCEGAMTAKRENRRYVAGGLPQVVLVGVEVRRCPQCGAEELVIPRIEELHRVLAQALINKPARLAPTEVRFLRKYLGWSSVDFAKHMGTTRETVSRWEGGLPIGPQADRLLRVLVARTAPVEDYSTDTLTEIRETERAPARLNLVADKGGWHIKQAA